MSKSSWNPGAEAVAVKGWFAAHKWLILRRISQLGILGLFLVGPISAYWAAQTAKVGQAATTGFWPVKGTLAYSHTLDFLPLTDPFVALQSLVAGHVLETTALIGLAIVVVFYLIVSGRSYCSWVCPINLVTDAAHWLRQKMGLRGGLKLSRQTRYWVVAMTLLVSGLTGAIVWELVNPITIMQRGILFGVGLTWTVVLGVFLYDMFVARRGWCSHLCPVGAFYSLIGIVGLVKVSAPRREACNNCMDCFAVCPESQVITPALKGADKGLGPVILSPNCTNCGRCIDVCAPRVFEFSTRFHNPKPVEATAEESPKVPKAA